MNTTQQSTEPQITKPATESDEVSHSTEQQPILKFATFIVRCPCLLCVTILLVLFCVTYIDGLFFVYTTDANRMYLVESNKWVEKQDAFVLAQQYVASSTTDNETVTPQSQSIGFWTYQLMFKLHNDDVWILTKENIEIIIEYENKIFLDDKWQNEFCLIRENSSNNNYNFSCDSSIQSIAHDMYYSFNYSIMTDNDIRDYVLSQMNNPYYSVLFNPDINVTKQSNIYRSIFHAAAPISDENMNINNGHIHLSEYKNAEDRIVEQESIYSEWATKYWEDITVSPNGQYVDSSGNLEILAVSYVVFVEYFLAFLGESMIFMIFSIFSVLIYMTFHLKSFILAFFALIEILMSFPLAFFFYRLIFQVNHFDTFSSLIIFVLLGVGADDVFVFTDAWYQSINFIKKTNKELVDDDTYLLKRMSFTYNRASKAMFITQITTFFAFLATATSLIMPISAFGIWAGTIILCNFLLVITLYPVILIIHHKYLKKYEIMICCCFCNLICSNNKEANDDDEGDNYRAIEKFFGGKFTDFILKFRVFILIFFVIIYGLSGYGATQLTANEGDEKWFEDDHFMTVVQESADAFSAGETDGLYTIWLVWGINGVNRDGTSKWDSEDYGEVIWDDTFDFSSYDEQLFIKDLCDDLKESHLSFSAESVICFTDYFEFYLNSNNLSYPLILSDDANDQKSLFAQEMYDFLHHSDDGAFIRNYGLVHVDQIENEYFIKFASFEILSDVSWSDSNDKTETEFDLWNEWVNDMIYENDDCPSSLQSAYHTSWVWANFATQDAFISSAIQGVLIAMPLAFLVLLISTSNWIISIFAVLDIIGIMLCELYLMVLMDWEFGISEAISIVIIIGFSVDYVVHLANAYLEVSKEYKLRNERLRFALLTIGISVLSGAITTFSAGFFLIFPVIIFFTKMGILMMSTIVFSLFFAMFFFTSLLAQFGPQYETGNINIKKYCRWCSKPFKKKENDVGDEQNQTNNIIIELR